MGTSRVYIRRVVVVLGVVLLLVALGSAEYLRGLSFVVRAAGLQGAWAQGLAGWQAQPFTVSELELPSRHGPVRARLYRPQQPRGRTVLLTPGVHADGVAELRLVKLAGDLAAGGLTVVTPELPDLLRYQITPRLPDMLEDAATWVVAQPSLAPDGRVGFIGISFAGGLSVVAAGRPALHDKVAFTLSFGGHGDLPRVLRYLCTGIQPGGQRRPPHDYGVVVVLLNVADRLVPPEQVEPLRRGILTFLRASHEAMVDAHKAEATFARARAMQAELPEPAATLLGYVSSRNVEALGPLLLPYVEGYAASPSLSPERSPPPSSPVLLLHGEGDNVIPAVESSLLARHLEPHTRVHLLITPLITHAEMDREVGLADLWRMVAFWSRVLEA